MIDKLKSIADRYAQLSSLLSDSSVIADMDKWKKYAKEHSECEAAAALYDRYVKLTGDMSECGEIIADGSDAELVALAKEDIDRLRKDKAALEEEIREALLPQDPDDGRNVIIEIRSGAGGEEAGLFGAVLQRMYCRFAERMRWKIEQMSINETDLGGVKESVFMISGKGVFSMLKYESGVHRVQRVPQTESQGRIHTSTVTVAVLPEAKDVDIELNESDIKVDTYRSSGAGGQHVNKTESAIRMTHIPTGIVVECQNERSQIKNRETAYSVLKARLYDYYKSMADDEYARNRRSQVGTGDRSERIRTYNYPQGRVTDHRIGMTLYSLDAFLDGDILEMIKGLQIEDRRAKLSGGDA